MKMKSLRPAGLVPLMAFVVSLPAAAQSDCGRTELVASGESLEAMAARCGTTASDILGANPDISLREVKPGLQLTMPAGQVEDDWLSRARSAVKEAGDRINEAATAAGRSASEYLSEQPDLNRDLLELGERLGLPGVSAPPVKGPSLTAVPSDDAAGREVRLKAEGLPGNTEIVITAEAEGIEPEVLWSGQANTAGRIDTTVSLPDKFGEGQAVRFVARTADERLQLASESTQIPE
jgi:hypothetical protein